MYVYIINRRYESIVNVFNQNYYYASPQTHSLFQVKTLDQPQEVITLIIQLTKANKN